MPALLNFIARNGVGSRSEKARPVHNPASAEVLATVALSGAAEVHTSGEAAHNAFPDWRRIPSTSFFGGLQGRGRGAFRLLTVQKVVIERWPFAVARLF